VVDFVLNGTFICTHEFAARCIAQGRPGAMLNIGATQSARAALRGRADHPLRHGPRGIPGRAQLRPAGNCGVTLPFTLPDVSGSVLGANSVLLGRAPKRRGGAVVDTRSPPLRPG
jgi:hypothetical protein